MTTTTVLESLPTARPPGRPLDPPGEVTAELRLGVAAQDVPLLPDAALYGAARLPVLCSAP